MVSSAQLQFWGLQPPTSNLQFPISDFQDGKEVMNMTTLTLELPKDLLRLLQKRASEEGQEPQEAALRILKEELTPEAKSERERIEQALEDSGLIRPLSPELREKYVRRLDPIERERIRQELAKKTFTPPLSEIIIQGRGER